MMESNWILFSNFRVKISSNLGNHHLEDGLVESSKPTQVVSVVTFSSELPNSVESSKAGSAFLIRVTYFKSAAFFSILC